MMYDVSIHLEKDAMRTTLSIDDDILMAAKSLAEREHKTIGQVVSEWSRQALRTDVRSVRSSRTRNGVPLLPPQAKTSPVTMELVNRLRDELL